MQSDIKSLPKSQILITIEVTEEELKGYEDMAAKRVSEAVEIPGFRKGQAPKAFVISKIGPDAFFQEVLNVALPRSYYEAVKDKKLEVISKPEIKILSRSPLKFEAQVAVFPEIKLKGYEDLKIPEGDISVTDAEIDEVVTEMRRAKASYKTLERAIEKGDRIEIDFQGFDEGGAILEKTGSKNHPLFVGEGTLAPGFEEELVGMKVGEKKKFPLKFPKNFHHAPLKGKTVHFEVEMKRGEETILPEFDEAFIEGALGQKKQIAEFKEIIKKDLHFRKRLEDRRQRENQLLEKFLKDARFDTPPLLIEEEIDAMIADLAREFEQNGADFEALKKKLEAEKRDLKKEYAAEAEKRVRVRLIISFLFRKLAIEVNDEDMKRASERLLARTPEKDKTEVSKNLNTKGDIYLRLRNNLMLEKLFARFLD